MSSNHWSWVPVRSFVLRDHTHAHTGWNMSFRLYSQYVGHVPLSIGWRFAICGSGSAQLVLPRGGDVGGMSA